MKIWKVRDVMTRSVVTARPDMSYREVADLLVNRMISAVPVVDDQGHVIGVLSEADLLPKIEYADRLPHHPLAMRRMSHLRRRTGGTLATDAMTKPAVTIGQEASLVDAARRLDAARVKRLPVIDEDGRLVGIVSRRDLVRLYTRPDPELRGEILDAICAAFGTEVVGLDVQVRAGTATLSGSVARSHDAQLAEDLTRSVPGVVSVVNKLSFEIDNLAGSRSATQWSTPVA